MTRTSPVARALCAPIRLYRLARDGRPSPCRFVPSCSAYALEALESHGAVKGSWFTVCRLCRCRPGGGSGIDLVPAPRRHHRTRVRSVLPVRSREGA